MGLKMENKQAMWNWPEVMLRRIPANYLLVSYLLFILVFLIYYSFSLRVFWFQWHIYHILQSLATSLLIAYLLAGLVYLSEKTRRTFKYIDWLYGSHKEDYFAKIESRVTGGLYYHLLFYLSLLVPFIVMSWGQWPYYERQEDIWARGLDIYGYFLYFLILALLAEVLWLMANIVWSVNEMGCSSSAFSAAVGVYGIDMKLRPVRNFFLIFIVYYFIAIALVIGTYISPSGQISIEPIYFGVLLAMGVVLFVAGLEAVQRIINCRVENELDILNKKRNEQHQALVNIVSSGSAEKAKDIENASKILDIIHKERESLLQVSRRAYDIATLSLFISSFLIPLLTLLEKLGLIHK
ncbi:hypothetical protein [Methanothrix sp.]|jgi:hypothetical protein|uniref:hypothetical protein n=2 Tax=Methanothrix sp. TaxID=90426 RepID=UPI0032AF08EC